MSFTEQLSGRGKFNLILFFIILPVLGLCAIFILLNINKWNAAKPGIPVTFDTIADHERDRVSIQGYFWLRRSVTISTDCSCGGGSCSDIELIPLEKGTGWITDDLQVSVELDSTSSGEPNHFYLPSGYTDNDFKIYTIEGQELGIDDAVQVVGTVKYVAEQGATTVVKLCPVKIEAVD